MTIISERYANDTCHAVETRGGYTLQMREHDRLGFTLGEYQRRYDHVLANMKDAGVDILVIRSPENICYLTGHETPGYYGYHCLLVSAQEEPVLVVRRIEEINAPEFSWLTRTVPVEDYQYPFEFVIEELKKMNADNACIGVEKGMGHDRRCHEKRGFMFTVAEQNMKR
jgi:Xaa-Pro dipeptidase